MNPTSWLDALERRGEFGAVPRNARVEVVGGAVDEAADVAKEKASAHS